MKGCVEFFSSSYNNANPPLIFLLELLQGTYYFQILGFSATLKDLLQRNQFDFVCFYLVVLVFPRFPTVPASWQEQRITKLEGVGSPSARLAIF